MLRIGKIPYTNLFPFYHHLERLEERGYEFIEGVPSEINRLMRGCSIDVSPSSSVEYLRGMEHYIVIPGHSISSEGPAGSILLFSRKEIEDLDGERVLYSHQSETSALLLRVVLSRFHRLRCVLKESRLPLEDGLRNHPAYLLIGDDALREASRGPDLLIYDLGEIWYRETGLPFVFALWIMKREAEEKVGNFVSDLDDARTKAFEDLPAVARACPSRRWLSIKALVDYWKGLSYDLEERHWKGLELFRRYLEELRCL